MTFAGINYLAILIAAVAGWLAGAVYYMALGKQWVAAQGSTMEAFKARQAALKGTSAAWLPFALAFLAEPRDGLGAGRHGRTPGQRDDPQRRHLGLVRLGWLRRHHDPGEQRLLGPPLRADRDRRRPLARRAA